MSMKSLNEAIKAARSDAHREAKKDFPCVVSRGIQLYITINGNRCDEAVVDKIGSVTKSDCADLILVHDQNVAMGHKVELWISGGYDGADSVHDIKEGHYEPWASNWDVEVKVAGNILEAIIPECEVDPKD